jgi:hypothetical protein
MTSQLAETSADIYAVGTCAMDFVNTNAIMATQLGTIAVQPISGLSGVDCTYIPNMAQSPIIELQPGDRKQVLVKAHSPDTCCKACIAVKGCTGATFREPSILDPRPRPPKTEGPGAGPQPGECFGIHVSIVPGHESLPGMAVAEVEQHFATKLKDLNHRFDPFLDYNVLKKKRMTLRSTLKFISSYHTNPRTRTFTLTVTLVSFFLHLILLYDARVL